MASRQFDIKLFSEVQRAHSMLLFLCAVVFYSQNKIALSVPRQVQNDS